MNNRTKLRYALMDKKISLFLIIGLTGILLSTPFLASGCGGGGKSSKDNPPANTVTEEHAEVILTDEQAQEVMDVFDEGSNYYHELLNQTDPDAIQKTVDWFKSQESVEDAAAGSGTIWIKYKAGEREAVLFTHQE